MDNFELDEIKRVAFDKFDYDIGPLKEIQLLFFLVSIALQKSEAQFQDVIDSKIEEVGNSISKQSQILEDQLDSLGQIYQDIKSISESIKENSESARESVIQAIKAGSAAVATQSESSVKKLTEHMESSTSELLDQVGNRVSSAIDENIDTRVGLAIDRKFEETGNPLTGIITTLKSTNEETERHTTNIVSKLNSSNKKMIFYCLGGALIGSSLTFLSLLLLQSTGVIDIPFQVTLDANSVAQYIMKSMQH